MDRSKKPRSSNLASHRRFELLDLNKSSSSLNMSTSSLRSVGEEARKGSGAVQASRRAATVRFAPPPLSSATKASSGPAVSHSQSQQALAMERPATASGARPGSASGTRCRAPAGRLPEPAGPKAMRRSWGWTASELDAKEPAASGNPLVAKVAAKTHSRTSSAPRRSRAEEKEKPLPKRGSKIMTTSISRTKTNLDTPPKTETQGSRSLPGIAAAWTNMKAQAPNSVSLKKMDTVSPPPTKTSVAMIGACWESLPSDLQNLGLEVMRYRDDAEAAAVEALRESSAAETLLRCLSAFADLTSAVPELSPQQTVDEFLALHGALAAAIPRDDKREGHAAGAWLRAAVTTDLASFSLYSAASPSKSSGAASLTGVSPASPPPPAQRPVPSGEAGMEESWLEAARRALGEEMRAWFLGHVERLLDGDVAGTLGQLKRVNDWLDAVGLGPESKAVERVRKKIYGYLLDHVESAVVALNGGVAAARRK